MSQKYVEKEFDAADFMKKSAVWYMSRAEYNPCSTKCGRELSCSREPKQVCVLCYVSSEFIVSLYMIYDSVVFKAGFFVLKDTLEWVE